MQATLEVARRVDRAEIEFCAAGGGPSVKRLEAGGGVALFSKPGSPLNKVLGLGLHGPVSDDDLDAIEAFYKRHEVPAQIELCPLAYADVAARLCGRGFVVQAFENQLGRTLPARELALPEGVEVVLVGPDLEDAWLDVVSRGFVAGEQHVGGQPDHGPGPSLDDLAGMMRGFQHPEIRRTVARIDGEIAGGGASWARNGVVGIFGTATHPSFRRRGVQTALNVEILRHFEGRAEIATATTAPGSTSQRTFERLGFGVLYTRAIFVKA